jgi:hypothetical protein
MVARTMRHEVIANTLLLVHGPGAVDPVEWSAYCVDCATLSYEGELVVVDRGCVGPTSQQRAELSSSFAKRAQAPNVAIVTTSAAHRGIATVLNWLQKGTLKLYTPARMDEALAYAGVAVSARATVLRRIHELAASLDSTWIVQTIALAPTSEKPM